MRPAYVEGFRNGSTDKFYVGTDNYHPAWTQRLLSIGGITYHAKGFGEPISVIADMLLDMWCVLPLANSDVHPGPMSSTGKICADSICSPCTITVYHPAFPSPLAITLHPMPPPYSITLYHCCTPSFNAITTSTTPSHHTTRGRGLYRVEFLCYKFCAKFCAQFVRCF